MGLQEARSSGRLWSSLWSLVSLSSLGFVEGPFIISLSQIRDFLQQLKGRVAREAIQRVHSDGPKGQRLLETQIPAPIEVSSGKALQGRWRGSWEDKLVR